MCLAPPYFFFFQVFWIQQRFHSWGYWCCRSVFGYSAKVREFWVFCGKTTAQPQLVHMCLSLSLWLCPECIVFLAQYFQIIAWEVRLLTIRSIVLLINCTYEVPRQLSPSVILNGLLASIIFFKFLLLFGEPICKYMLSACEVCIHPSMYLHAPV